MSAPPNRAGACAICARALAHEDDKRIATDGSLVVCPQHAACQVRVINPILRRNRATLVFVRGSSE